MNLGALSERWVKIEFLCDFYKGTDVPLLKFGEEDYEALENDQLTVQGMMASRYIAQFEKEVSTWSVALLNVSDSVLKLKLNLTSGRWRLHDHQRVSTSRECTETVP